MRRSIGAAKCGTSFWMPFVATTMSGRLRVREECHSRFFLCAQFLLAAIHKSPNEDNGTCADCGFVPTKFASLTLGVFLCADCADVHQEALGDMSVIRDISEPYEITTQQRFDLETSMGNNKRNKIYEKNAAKRDVPRPRPTDSRDVRSRWIKAKYLAQAFESSPGGGSSTPASRRLSSQSFGGATELLSATGAKKK